MDEREFIKTLNETISNNKIDQRLLNSDNRFHRGNLLFKIINSLSKILNYFDYRNEIIFDNKIPFILVDNIKLMICNQYFLKNVNGKISSSFAKTEEYLKKLNLNPKYIIDIGACWGECSIYLASRFDNSKIFSIEGSLKNYDILKTNLLYNKTLKSNIYPFNIIISDRDGFEEISNDLTTMNVLRNSSVSKKLNFNEYKKVKSYSLLSFLNKNKISSVDFLKIDIEGSELLLLNDLMKADIYAIQIELINYNSIDDNIYFLSSLSNKYKFHSLDSFNILDFENLCNLVKSHLDNNQTIDLYLSKK